MTSIIAHVLAQIMTSPLTLPSLQLRPRCCRWVICEALFPYVRLPQLVERSPTVSLSLIGELARLSQAPATGGLIAAKKWHALGPLPIARRP